MDDTALITTALSALQEDRLSRVSCMVFNDASDELQQIGIPSLAPIRNAIEILLRQSRDCLPPGLDNVLVTYFHIILREPTAEQEALALLDMLPPRYLARAIQAIWTTWLTYADSPPIPAGIKKAIDELSSAGPYDVRAAANRLLQRHLEVRGEGAQ